jgi:hypothetical protein
MAGTVVVKQVVAEMRAKSDELDHALAETERKAKRTKTQIEGTGTAASGLGNRYGSAAQQIAMATEAIARNGKVTGEAAKQILAQGSQIAFAFGAGGAIVGALSIFGLAAVTAFKRAREEAEKAQQAFDVSLEKFRLARDYRGASGLIVTLLQGDPEAEGEAERLGLLRLRDRVAQERAALAASRPEPGVRQTVGQISERRERIQALRDLEQALARFEARYAEASATFAIITAQEQERLQNERRNAGEEKDILEARATVQRAFADAAKRSQAAIADFDKDVADFGREFDALVLREVATEVDRVRASFDRLIAQGERTVGANDPRVQRLREMRDAAVGAAQAAALKERLDRIKKPVDDTTRSTADLAREIQQAVDGALQLAGAFGNVEVSVINVLRSIGQLAGNLPGFLGALDDLNTKRAGKTATGADQLRVLGAALPILGALATLVGDDPEEAARREEIRANTEAIRDLTKRAGLLGVGISGSQGGAAAAAVRAVLEGTAKAPSNARLNLAGVGAFTFAQFGLTFRELQEIAAGLGITLGDNRESFEALAAALADTITKLGEFGTDLESARQQADAEAEIFGVTDPLERLGLTLGAFGGRSPAFDALLNGLDLDTPEGRAEARRRAQDLFNILKAGGGTLDAGALGGLTGQQLLDAILALVSGLNDIDAEFGVSSGTQVEALQVSANTQITADQASRLLGLSATQVTLQREIRDLLANALLASVTPLALPAPGVFAAEGAAGATVTISIENVFNGPVSDAAGLDERQLALITEHIRRALGRDVQIRRQYSGKVGVS